MNYYGAIVEDKTGRGIYGHCPCVCSRIRNLTSMKLESIEFWLSAKYVSRNVNEGTRSISTCGMGWPW